MVDTPLLIAAPPYSYLRPGCSLGLMIGTVRGRISPDRGDDCGRTRPVPLAA
jgi:hypothetical protein